MNHQPPTPPGPPGSKDRVLLRGQVAKLKREGRFDEAIALVTRALQGEAPPTMDTLVWRAQLFAAAGRHLEALADLDAAAGRPGRMEIEAYDLRLRCLRAIGRDDLAQAFAASTPRPPMPPPAEQAAFWSWFGGAVANQPASEIFYQVGNAFGPGGAVGRDTLRLFPADTLELENEGGGHRRRWSGRLHAGGFLQIERLVATSGFPSPPPRPPVAGSALRTLTVGPRSVMVPFHDLDSVRGYRVLFEAIDALVDDVKAGRVSGRLAEVRGPEVTGGG